MATVEKELVNLLGSSRANALYGLRFGPTREDESKYPDQSEPLFILRAQDRSAPAAVLEWIEKQGKLDLNKQAEAYEAVAAMLRWQAKHSDLVKDAD